MIIRKSERLRMNILSILSILPPRSSLRKVKMLKVFKMLKGTMRQSMSSLLSASTVPGGAGCAEGTKVRTKCSPNTHQLITFQPIVEAQRVVARHSLTAVR